MMDESESLGDAEMRFVTVNGQTVMLEGDLGNMCVSNELLNEMLLIGNGKDDGSGGCGLELNGNSCANGLRGGSEDPTKIALTIQGENNEIQTIQIGMDEAKELGLYIYGIKNEGMEEWSQSCTVSNGIEPQEQISVVSINNVKHGNMTGESGSVCKSKLESMPLLDGDNSDKDQSMLLTGHDLGKENHMNGQVNGLQFSNGNQKADVQEENSSDNFPAIGHLEGFQIPTADDGTLLPATVNAKMADGSYQMLTLIPQVGDGSVTYSVQFANLDGDEIDSKGFQGSDSVEEYGMGGLCNGTADEKDMKKSKKSVVEEFLKSVQLKKNIKVKNASVDNIDTVSVAGTKNAPVNFVNLTMDQNILKLNNSSNFTVPDNFNFDTLSVNYVQPSQIQTPIEAKIDNLISENENVIAKCKKVKYGKKIRQADATDGGDLMQDGVTTKGSLVRGKKVKFKNRTKTLDDEVDEKKMKLSLLKPNNEQVQDGKEESLQGGSEADGTASNSSKNLISHVNLNCRLEYPNLKAIDDSSTSLPYIKMKTQASPKQPYFNVLPYPKDKAPPTAQRQYLPLSCDLQQAKNLISLQKFLETQKLQLKIQPINSTGSKMVNIRPKPALNNHLKTLQELGFAAPVLNSDGLLTNSPVPFLSPGAQDGKKGFADAEDKVQAKNAKDVLLSDGKVNVLKFLNAGEQGKAGEREVAAATAAEFDGKINGIFIKNNPEYFQKSKDGKAEEHPLGSSENPIQLVQTGDTFHSRQPLSETQLRQIASILQKQKFDSQNIKKNSIFDPKTNTRIVYRVVYPEDVELKKTDENLVENSIKKKRGRHRSKPVQGEEDAQKPLAKGPRRPKKMAVSSLDEDILEDEVEDSQVEQKKIPRTRSGRLSRPPRYMVKDYKRLHNSDVSEKNSNSNYESDEAYSDYVNEKEVTKERVNKMDELESNLLPGLRSPTRTKRNFKPEYRCPTCQKIYLGHSRMMWHLNKFPDHCNVEKYKEIYSRKPAETKVRRAARRLNMCDVSSNVKQVLSSMSKDELTSLCGPLLAEALTTWDFLLLRVNLLKEDMKGEVDALLHELAVLLDKLTKMAEDLFLPVFTKEGERDVDCVEIDRMEIAIALGLPIGFYKINNDNLNLLKMPLKSGYQEREEKEVDVKKAKTDGEAKPVLNGGGVVSREEKFEDKSFLEKTDKWEEPKDADKKLADDDFWMSEKTNESDNWQQTDDSASVKALATKFEPNLSTKLLESSNDSIDDPKYGEPVQLMDLDSNSKDVEHSNSSGNLDRSPDANLKDHSENSESTDDKTNLEKESLWDGQSQDKVPSEIWNENSNIAPVADKSWSDKSNLSELGGKRELWTEEGSSMNPGEKVDETNSEFLDSFLAVGNLGSESSAFLADSLMNDKGDKPEVDGGKRDAKKGEWREERSENFIRMWESDKNGEWSKEEADLLAGSMHERMPGLRTSSRLTSTPETNGNINFSIPNRRNSISDFSNINLESSGLDIVLPPAKTLIKERAKPDPLEKITGEAYPLKGDVFETEGSYKMKDWNPESGKADFAATNVNSEDLMKMALESLTSHSDVITVPQASFDSAMGILNPTPESGNLNLFASSEADALDFNLPLPEHLLRANFTTSNSDFPSSTYQTTCTSNFTAGSTVSPTFLSTTNNLFGATGPSSSMDQFDSSYPVKKSKSIDDDVIEFFDSKNPYAGYDACMVGGGGTACAAAANMTHFSFVSTSSHSDQFSVTQCLNDSIVSAIVPDDGAGEKKVDGREGAGPGGGGGGGAGGGGGGSNRGGVTVGGIGKTRVKKKDRKTARSAVKAKKVKSKKTIDYPKTNSIESIINEALFDSCASQCSSNSKSIQIENSSPNGTSTIPNGTDNYTLPIIPESLDEVGNLDFLNQD